jgi:hypothetical protein
VVQIADVWHYLSYFHMSQVICTTDVQYNVNRYYLNIQGDSEISLEKKPVIGDDEKRS